MTQTQDIHLRTYGPSSVKCFCLIDTIFMCINDSCRSIAPSLMSQLGTRLLLLGVPALQDAATSNDKLSKQMSYMHCSNSLQSTACSLQQQHIHAVCSNLCRMHAELACGEFDLHCEAHLQSICPARCHRWNIATNGAILEGVLNCLTASSCRPLKNFQINVCGSYI